MNSHKKPPINSVHTHTRKIENKEDGDVETQGLAWSQPQSSNVLVHLHTFWSFIYEFWMPFFFLISLGEIP